MNKKQLIVVLALSILINVVYYGNAYSDTKVSVPIKSSHKENVFDKMLYKEAILAGDGRPVLVNRLTGEVKYIWVNNSQWMLLTGTWKKQCQANYNAQVASKR